MNTLEAAYEVLKEAGEPLDYKELTNRMIEQGLWHTRGRTPSATVSSQLAVDIKKQGSTSRFRRVASGIYALAESSATSPVSPPATAGRAAAEVGTPSEAIPMSFLDAAEKVLRDSGSREAMSYLDVAQRAIAAGLIRTQGLTPEATLSAQVGSDIRRRRARGEDQRFVRPARGMIGLVPALPVAVEEQITEQNRRVQTELLERAKGGSPDDFEKLIGELLEAMNFKDVEVTRSSGDRGIDVRGTLVVASVVHIRMAVQAKRWEANVQRPDVQRLRGSLGAHEQGLIITTSHFSKGAVCEAERRDAPPVALMNGEDFARLLAENQIGAKRTPCDLWTLVEPEEPEPPG